MTQIPTGVVFQGEAVPFTRVPYAVTFSDGETPIMDPSKLAAGDVYWHDVRTAGTETKFER